MTGPGEYRRESNGPWGGLPGPEERNTPAPIFCSKCSEVVKPIVAVDIDGTLGDYHLHFVRFLEGYTGKRAASQVIEGNPQYGGGPPGSFREWCCDQFDIDSTAWDRAKLAYRQGAQKRTMPVFAGAYDLVRAVNESGAELWLTTTRPHLRLDGIDPDTRDWLRRNGLEPYYGLLYDEDKYRVLAERVDPARVVAVLDDLPEQVVEATEAFGPRVGMLRRGEWNQNVMVDRIGFSLQTATQEITRRIQTWQTEYRNQRG